MFMEAHAGDHGNCYTVVCSNDPNAATSDFLYIRNTSEKSLRIYKIKGYSVTLANTITVKTGVTGTPTAGATLTPTNALIGGGNLAEGVFETTDGAQSLALTGGNVFDTLFLNAATETTWCYPGEISIEKNQTLCLYAALDPTANLEFTIYFYYHEPIV